MASGKDRFITIENKIETTKRAKEQGLCRWCGEDVKRYSKFRRTFCSDDCVHQYSLRSSSTYVRKYIAKRDKYTCQICDLDCLGFLRKLKRFVNEEIHNRMAQEADLHKSYAAKQAAWTLIRKNLEVEFFDRYGMEWVNTRGRETFYDIDHIIPVIKGGAQCGEENLRTVCLRCHRIETAKLRKDLKNAKTNPGRDHDRR